MAILKIISHGKTNKSKMQLLKYVLNPQKTKEEFCYVTGDYQLNNITPQNVYQEFQRVRTLFEKNKIANCRTYTHGTIAFAKGEIKPEEAKNHPKGNVITKCLFVTDDKDRYMTPTITLIRDIKPHDVFMLCTDGVYGMVDNDDLVEILTSDNSLEDRTKELAAICRNSHDNNTAYIVEIDDIDDDDTEDKENITYTIAKPRKTIKSQFFDFVREALCLVK